VPKDIVAEIQADNWIDQKLWETWHDARHATSAVQPVALDSRSSSFISGEAIRFVNQIVRRVQRRWGNFGAEIPVPQGDRATLA